MPELLLGMFEKALSGGNSMEIERKFLVKKENLPENLEQYPCKVIEQ